MNPPKLLVPISAKITILIKNSKPTLLYDFG